MQNQSITEFKFDERSSRLLSRNTVTAFRNHREPLAISFRILALLNDSARCYSPAASFYVEFAAQPPSRLLRRSGGETFGLLGVEHGEVCKFAPNLPLHFFVVTVSERSQPML